MLAAATAAVLPAATHIELRLSAPCSRTTRIRVQLQRVESRPTGHPADLWGSSGHEIGRFCQVLKPFGQPAKTCPPAAALMTVPQRRRSAHCWASQSPAPSRVSTVAALAPAPDKRGWSRWPHPRLDPTVTVNRAERSERLRENGVFNSLMARRPKAKEINEKGKSPLKLPPAA